MSNLLEYLMEEVFNTLESPLPTKDGKHRICRIELRDYVGITEEVIGRFKTSLIAHDYIFVDGRKHGWQKIWVMNNPRKEPESMKYRKKPTVIEAFKLGVPPYPEWFKQAEDEDIATHLADKDGYEWYEIKTLEGVVKAELGYHYIIKGVQGEIYPCREDIFLATYELVEG